MGKIKKALITGITGQDGSYLSELLLKKNYKVYGIVRRVALEDETHRLWRIKHLLNKIEIKISETNWSLKQHETEFFFLEGLKRLSECYVKDDKIQEYFRKYYTIIVKYINHKSRGNLSHAFFICERDNYPKEINNIFIGNIWSYDDIVNISNMIGNINYLNVNERFDEVNIITETLEKILKTKREKFKNKLQT